MDVDAVDFGRVCLRDRPGDGVTEDAVVQPLALRRGHGLGVADARNVPIGMENDRRGDHRTGQTTPPDFVHAGDMREPAAPQCVLQRAHRWNAGHRK